jgi:putative oxidoreductase
MATTAAVSEASGLLFAAGFLTPFAALLMASTMVVAIGSVHWKNGFFVANGGYEFNLVLWTVAVAVAATGPGRFSVDAALGWADNLSGLWWGVGVLAASLASGGLVLAIREQQPEADATEAPLAREREEETAPVQS